MIWLMLGITATSLLSLLGISRILDACARTERRLDELKRDLY